MVDDLECQVCKNEKAVGVASSPLGPFSIAYGHSCLEAGAEPYWAIVATVAMCGGRSGVAEWVPPIIDASLKVAGKTMEQFDADVAKEIAEESP